MSNESGTPSEMSHPVMELDRTASTLLDVMVEDTIPDGDPRLVLNAKVAPTNLQAYLFGGQGR